MLDILPPEMLTSILGHTTKADQLNTSLVCRRVQSVICSTRSLKKRPDEIRISMKSVHPAPYKLGKIRIGKQKEQKGKRRFLVTLSRNRDTKGRRRDMDTLDADEVDDTAPSTSSHFPQLEEIISQCIHGHTLVLSSLTINSALLELLSSSSTELYRVTSITFNLCIFANEDKLVENLQSFFSKTSVEYLTIEFCREEGTTRIICDKLFCDLPHLLRIDLQEREPGTNAITANLVERWISTSVPYMINFHNVKTAISLESMRKLIEFTIRTRRKFKTVWNLGILDGSDKGELAALFLLSSPNLSFSQTIDVIGQRQIKIAHPFIELTFTSIGC